MHLTSAHAGSGFKIEGFPVDRVSATLNDKHLSPLQASKDETPQWVEFSSAAADGEYVATLKADHKTHH